MKIAAQLLQRSGDRCATVATVVSDMGMDNESVATGCQYKKISIATSNGYKGIGMDVPLLQQWFQIGTQALQQ